ncbi:MAG: SDR family oxidoreductase [Leptonema sp. (in: Bacteria)]|nr:SDR family oxidoreductase [Leptonema sp. (in: bacteria)]
MIVITGASGHLGHLVIKELLKTEDPKSIIAAGRDVAKLNDLSSTGIQIRHIDYNKPETIGPAIQGADKMLLISASTVGTRAVEHKRVIDAAKSAGIPFIVYTSLLYADTSPLSLAEEHRQTEADLKASGIPYSVLRNGWYSENYTENLAPALQHGAVLGCANDGKYSFAARADYAKAAAKVLTSENQAGKVYELAGDTAHSLYEYVVEVAKQSGKSIKYSNMLEETYYETLKSAGLPDSVAKMLSNSDTGASKGALFNNSGTLSKLIGQPTTPISESIKEALAKL